MKRISWPEPIQIPASAVGAEKPEPGTMQKPPRSRKERLIDWPLLARAYLFLGLLEAAAQVAVERRPVLLVAYDLTSPLPLHSLWPVPRPFAAALLLSPEPAGNLNVRMDIEVADGPVSQAWPTALPGELAANPSAQALVLLEVASKKGGGRAGLQYLRNSHVAVEIHP